MIEEQARVGLSNRPFDITRTSDERLTMESIGPDLELQLQLNDALAHAVVVAVLKVGRESVLCQQLSILSA